MAGQDLRCEGTGACGRHGRQGCARSSQGTSRGDGFTRWRATGWARGRTARASRGRTARSRWGATACERASGGLGLHVGRPPSGAAGRRDQARVTCVTRTLTRRAEPHKPASTTVIRRGRRSSGRVHRARPPGHGMQPRPVSWRARLATGSRCRSPGRLRPPGRRRRNSPAGSGSTALTPIPGRHVRPPAKVTAAHMSSPTGTVVLEPSSSPSSIGR